MALSIKDPETDELARRLARQTGESLTVAIRRAIQERLDRELKRDARLAERLLEIGRRCAATLEGPVDSADHGELFYDEQGLPR
jgi:antitoxin VapB